MQARRSGVGAGMELELDLELQLTSRTRCEGGFYRWVRAQIPKPSDQIANTNYTWLGFGGVGQIGSAAAFIGESSRSAVRLCDATASSPVEDQRSDPIRFDSVQRSPQR
ncbi:hypothetical protein M5D96_012037 [Drosophila gunungcola]|uniref:Uncharacterized protein n=1 Tax=Drosophila gunungcola TaxID=103775 RepID=A0A9Q0BKH8_9MUSC|nr:hypothetical protein M5D96_012037 [Drosophila gunungcola]